MKTLAFLLILIFAANTPLQAQDLTQVPSRQAKLLSELKSEDRRIRRKAAEELGRSGTSEAVIEGLLGALKDPDRMVAAQAALSLGELKSSTAVPHLIAALSDLDEDLRSNAAIALGRIADPKAVPALLELLKDPKPFPRASAATALGRIGSNRATIHLTALLLNDPDTQVRTSAAEALGALADPSAKTALVSAIKDKSNYVRTAVAAALGQLSIDDSSFEALVTAMKDEDRMVRAVAAESLGRSRDERAIHILIEALTDLDPFVRTNAAHALGKLGSRQAIEPLIDTLRLDEPRVKIRAAEALAAIGDPKAIEPLVALLDETNRLVKISATIALGRIGDRRATESLIRILRDSDAELRRAAILALGNIGDVQAFEPLLELLAKDRDSIQTSIISVLAKLDPKRSLPILVEKLSDNSIEIRLAAATELARLDPDDVLANIFSQKRQLSADALEAYFRQAPKALSSLETAAQTSNAQTRRRALLIAATISKLELIIDGLEDPIADNRLLALELLANSNRPEILARLQRTVSEDSDITVRNFAAAILKAKGLPAHQLPTAVLLNFEEIPPVATLAIQPAPHKLVVLLPPLESPPEVEPQLAMLAPNLIEALLEPVQPNRIFQEVALASLPTTVESSTFELEASAETMAIPMPTSTVTDVPKLPEVTQLPQAAISIADIEHNLPSLIISPLPLDITLPTRPTLQLDPTVGDETAILETLKALVTAQRSYFGRRGSYATLDQLVSEGLARQQLESGEIAGYEIRLYVSAATKRRAASYFILAVPIDKSLRAFFVDEDEVLRSTFLPAKVHVGEIYGSWTRVEN